MIQTAASCRRHLLAATLVATLAGGVWAQNLIRNGGFEEGLPLGSFTYYGRGSTNMPHWEVTGNSIDHIATYWQPGSGGGSLDLNGGNNGGVKQTIATTPGVTYVVSFAMAANTEGGPDVKTMRVRAGEQESADFSFDGVVGSREDMRWSFRRWQFVATQTATEMEFFSTVYGGWFGPALDDVRVEGCIGAVVRPLVTACRGMPVTIASLITGESPLAMRWQVEDASAPGGWRDLSEGPFALDGVDWGVASGVDDATLTVTPDPSGSFARPQIRLRTRVANDCQSIVTLPTTLSVCQCLDCPADYNQDGGVDGGDIDVFFAAWESGGCDGDVNADGGVDSGDVEHFFASWEAGGC
jgi:choice-of-anchor C domain-containing protein